MMLRSGQALSQSRSRMEPLPVSKCKPKSNQVSKKPNVRNSSTPSNEQSVKGRPSKSGIPTPKSVTPLGKSRKDNYSSLVSREAKSNVGDGALSSQRQRLSFTNKSSTSSSNDNSKVQDLIALNNELLKRIEMLEEQLELSQKQVTAVKTNNTDSVIRETPPSNNSSFSEWTSIDQVQPPPLIMDISGAEDSTPPDSSPVAETRADQNKPKFLIIGDSMARGFADSLKILMPNYSVSGHIYPGSSLEFILSLLPTLTSSLSKIDTVFIMAGLNNVPYLYPTMLEQLFTEYKFMFTKTKIIFSGIPYVYHMPHLNSNVFATNLCLLRLSSKFNFYVFNCNLFLSRFMYTRHGLHLNSKGKVTFCNKLAASVPAFVNSSFLASAPLLTQRAS